jgi:3-oxoacyl-(acyl-carrier-protein) synthase
MHSSRRPVGSWAAMKTLDYSSGNAVPIMAQKSLVGHSKGGTPAWQMAGHLQLIGNGVVPGNRNAIKEAPRSTILWMC